MSTINKGRNITYVTLLVLSFDFLLLFCVTCEERARLVEIQNLFTYSFICLLLEQFGTSK